VPTIANPYGYNDPALGAAVSNISKVLFSNGPNEQALREGRTAYLREQAALAKAKTDAERAELAQMYSQQDALNQAADMVRNGIDWMDPRARAGISAFLLQAGGAAEDAPAALYYSGDPTNEVISRFLLPGMTGENVGLNQFATTPGAEAARTRIFEHEAALNDADNAAAFAREQLKIANPKPPTPIDITPAEAIRLQDLIAYNLGTQAEDVDPATMSYLTDLASRYYRESRNAGEAAARAIRETVLETEEVGKWNPFVENRTVVRMPAAPQPGAGTAVAAPPNIPPPAQRIRGKIYQTPRGPMVWTGTGWVPAG
jgi:hypothetical protein